MTLYIPINETTGRVSFNQSNLSGDFQLKITSQYSQEVTTWDLTLIGTNDRYSEFTLTFTEEQRKAHKNGIYNYTLVQSTTELESGLLKLVIEDGGSYDTVKYVSNNEDREATVYYRPEY